MKQFFMTVVVVGVMALLLTSVAHADSKGKRFIALWEGIDEVDGSEIKILINDDGNGAFKLLWRETFFTVCANNGFDSGGGVIKGTAALDPGNQDILLTVIYIFCIEGTTSTRIDINVGLISFELIDKNRLLVTNENNNFPPFILERISCCDDDDKRRGHDDKRRGHDDKRRGHDDKRRGHDDKRRGHDD